MRTPHNGNMRAPRTRICRDTSWNLHVRRPDVLDSPPHLATHPLASFYFSAFQLESTASRECRWLKLVCLPLQSDTSASVTADYKAIERKTEKKKYFSHISSTACQTMHFFFSLSLFFLSYVPDFFFFSFLHYSLVVFFLFLL